MNSHATLPTRKLSALASIVVVGLCLAGCGGGGDGDAAPGGTDDAITQQSRSASPDLPSSLSQRDYNRLRDALDDDEVPRRVVPRLDASERLRFSGVDDAAEAFVDAITDADFARADRVFASAPADWRYDLTDAADDAARIRYKRGDYATSYRLERYLHMDERAFWILDAEYVQGRVVDKGTGAPIAGARVASGEPSYEQATETGADGAFRVLMPKSTPSGVTVEHPDYGATRVFNTSGGAPMTPEALAGETLEIVLGTGFPKLTFRGRVIDADTGEPLGGVPVVAGFDPIDGAPELNLRQVMGSFGRETDADGRFEITELPVRDIHVLATAMVDGKLYQLKRENLRFEDGVEQVIEVSSRAVQLDVPLVIAGTVRDRVTGEPIRNAKVSAGGWENERTDANGRFMMQLATGKDWQLTASHDAYHRGRPQPFASPKPKTIEAEFLLDPITTGTIFGTAINAVTGEPIANAVIAIAGQQVRTDSQGRFRAEDIESGAVTVNAAQSGYRGDSASLVLEALETAEATLELEPITTGTVAGVVIDAATGSPLAGVAVRGGNVVATTGDDGRFVLEEVEAGTVTVAASMALYEPGSSDVALAALENVETEVGLTPITWGTVRGVVTDAQTGQPLADATVSLGAISVTTDGSGGFVAEQVPAGDVSIRTEAERYRGAQVTVPLARDDAIDMAIALEPITTGTIYVTVIDAVSGQPIREAKVMVGQRPIVTGANGQASAEDIPAGNVAVNATARLYEPGSAEAMLDAASESRVEIRLTPVTWGTVRGRVVNAETDDPIEGASVTDGRQRTRTDAAGEFELQRVAAGEISVLAAKAVHVDESATVDLAAGNTASVTLRLQPITWGAVTGIVTDAGTGRPLAGAAVVVGKQSLSSDAGGRFRAERVEAGALQVTGNMPAYEPGAVTARLEPDSTQDVALSLTPIRIGSISGTVVDAKTGEPIARARVTTGGLAAETDAAGKFRFEDVGTGGNAVGAKHPDYADGSASAKVPPAETVDVVIRLDLRREDVTNLEAELAEHGTIDLYGIYFDSGKDQFKPSSLQTLRAVLEVMKRAPNRRFAIAGHTDSDGGDAFNQDLSERRAKTVIRWLVANGIDADRLDGVGFGETRPAAPNDTETGKALNRRVQLSFAD